MTPLMIIGTLGSSQVAPPFPDQIDAKHAPSVDRKTFENFGARFALAGRELHRVRKHGCPDYFAVRDQFGSSYTCSSEADLCGLLALIASRGQPTRHVESDL